MYIIYLFYYILVSIMTKLLFNLFHLISIYI